MRLLVEGCKYDKELLEGLLGEAFANDALDGNGKFRYVGYLWNDEKNEAVFFLPKVVVYKPDDEEKDSCEGGKRGRVFGEIEPSNLANNNLTDADFSGKMTKRQKDFLIEFAIRIYRALAVFKKTNPDNSVAIEASSMYSVRGVKHVCETRLDVILALIDFYWRNRDFVIFTAKRCHNGFNKVNWTKTVAKKRPFFDESGTPVYVEFENKRKRIDFEEELLVIFHSILHYVGETWGFPIKFDLNYEPIAGAKFKRYLDGYGTARLRAIKYRYFSDKLLELWELCHLFFKTMRSSTKSSTSGEYLFAKKFDVVFENMVDELVGERNLPKELKSLKNQKDGKRADHIFLWPSLCEQMLQKKENRRNVCYVGDSKYYGIGNEVGEESIAKQFTYAKNVIQWNIDQHLANKQNERFPVLRDDLTQGYDIVPNFFISAYAGIGKENASGFEFDKDGLKFDEDGFFARKFNPDKHFSRQFENRLFDRDTLHIAHFDVNFFYIIALYGRDNAAEKETWKRKIRDSICREILKVLYNKYNFFILAPSDGELKDFIDLHFMELLGKVFSVNNEKCLLALEKRPDDNADVMKLPEAKMKKLDENTYMKRTGLD